MTRQELASLGGSKVRKDNALFALFKKYITEDAAHLFSGGNLPSGCFGCSFQSYYRQWSTYVLNNSETNEILTTMANSEKTYKLADPRFRVYFKSGILDRNSSDEQWIDWIRFLPNVKQKDRKQHFAILPEAIRPKKEKDAKKAE